MPKYWNIPDIWEGECFIIGGGTSLKNAPFHLLHDKHTIGCNNAFELGAKVCEVCCFGDLGFYNLYKNKNNESKISFRDYKGLLVSNATKMPDAETQVKICKRTEVRVEKATDTLSWYHNTGVLAVELAIKLGATRIILLGFDMRLDAHNTANWYKNIKDKPNKATYPRFMNGFKAFSDAIHRSFPKVEIINGNPASAMDIFPKQDWRELV
jgi:hypothetical protein